MLICGSAIVVVSGVSDETLFIAGGRANTLLAGFANVSVALGGFVAEDSVAAAGLGGFTNVSAAGTCASGFVNTSVGFVDSSAAFGFKLDMVGGRAKSWDGVTEAAFSVFFSLENTDVADAPGGLAKGLMERGVVGLEKEP